MPVASRPPWVKISKRGAAPSARRAWRRWRPRCIARRTSPTPRAPGSRSFTAAVLIDTLSAPASSSARTSSTLRTPPPTVSGMKQRSAVRAHHVEDGAALLVAGGDVEEAELVGAGLVIGRGGLDRIAGVAQIDEIDALDDAAFFHVEAGDDADFQHGSRSTALRIAVAPADDEGDDGGNQPHAEQHGAGRQRQIGIPDQQSRDRRRSGRNPCRRSRTG